MKRAVLALFLAASAAPAADISGIWTGQQPGRNGQIDDVAFRFKMDGQTLTGKFLGDEFDVPIANAAVTGDQIRFTVVTTNYYSGGKTEWLYTGVVKGGEMELTRERVQTPQDSNARRQPFKTTVKLKRIT
jgi:hypothetical protein